MVYRLYQVLNGEKTLLIRVILQFHPSKNTIEVKLEQV